MKKETALVPIVERALPAKRAEPTLLEMWLGGRSRETRRAYTKDIEHFAQFLEMTVDQAVTLFLSSPQQANTLALSFMNSMRDPEEGEPLSPATVNRRLAALRSLVKVARLTGRITFVIDVENVKDDKYTDTRGPGVDAIKKMLAVLPGTQHEIRNRAILAMLFAMGLRRGELAGLHLEHVDLQNSRVAVLGKRRKKREWFTMPSAVHKTLLAWIEERGRAPGSLFGLTSDGVYFVVTSVGVRAGVGHVRPHGIRHTSITHYLEKSGGNQRAASAFARHDDPRVTQRYDDNRADAYGQAANLLGDDVFGSDE